MAAVIDAVIESRIVEELIEGFDRSGLGICRAPNNRWDSRL